MRCYSIALVRDGFGVLGMSLSQQIAAITALVSLRSEKEAATVVKKFAGRLFAEILNIILPIFFVLLPGYAAGRANQFDNHQLAGITNWS